jgi:hypothetical protein
MLATNLLFQPVALDQLTTMIVLWLALRLALGRGSWPLIGIAVGIGLETKYTLAVVLVLLIATFLVWRRDALSRRGFPLAVAVAAILLVPNLVWQANHGWTSVHWFLNPPPSGSDETRPVFIANVILLTGAAVPVAVAGVILFVRDRALRPFGWTIVGTVVAYFVLGGKSYYALPVLVFALAAGSIPLDRWATRRRLQVAGAIFVTVRLVERHAAGADVILTDNYGEAGALVLFGRGLPQVASADVTMRYWRPRVTGRRALLVGFTRHAASFCRSYRVVAHISTADESDDGGEPIASCTLRGTLAEVWPTIVATQD